MHSKNKIFVLLLTALAVLLSGCEETKMSDLIMRRGLAYKKGGGLYSGSVVSHFPQSASEKERGEDPRPSLEGAFKDGRKEGDWTTFSWNGEYAVMPYENGKRHGLAKWYYASKKTKREQWYGNNMRHGSGTTYNPAGQVTRQVFYEYDRMRDPVGKRRAGIEKLTTDDEEAKGPGFFKVLIEALDDLL